MKTRKFILALATAVAITFGPQLAHAACSGDACHYLDFDGTTVINKDGKAMVIGVCYAGHDGPDYGTCRNSARIHEFTIGPASRLQVRTRDLEIRNVTVELRSAKFIPDRSTPGPKPVDKAPVDKALVDKVTVTNGGQVPLKVVILDMGKVDIGRTPDYMTGKVDIALKKGVAKYHWEAFTPGAVEPCQVVHDVTASSITVQCQRPKVPDAAHQLVTRPVSADSGLRWAEKCRADGAGGPTACCERQRKAEPYCMQQPQSPSSSADCQAAETLCRQTQRTSLKPDQR